MGKKIANVLLFVVVVAAAAGMTVYVGQGAKGLLIYNFIFLGIMIVIYLLGMIGGIFQVNNLSNAFNRAAQELTGIFKTPGRADTKNLSFLEEIFNYRYLDRKMDTFVTSIDKSQEGIGEIEEYINEDEIDVHIHKRLLELVPDILTSLGILGTFVGLVWGLKDFQPNDYALMTSSVASLVEGIKVAFLTSIYGISLSIIYTFGVKSEYASMSEKLQDFLGKFHAYVLPTAENESRNLLLSSQKLQTQAMKQMAEQFSVQMADSFEKVITPTFRKMNDSLDTLVTSVTQCQQDAVKDILDVFMKEMRGSFRLQFNDFNEALAQLKKVQQETAGYTSSLYQDMSGQLNDSFLRQEKSMTAAVEQMGRMQNRYMDAAAKIIQDNQAIQKMQQQDYQNVTAYMKEAEQSAAKFWVACNQTMQKYVETAAQSMEKAASASQQGGELLRASRTVIEDFDGKMKEFVEYQKVSLKMMDQMRRILSDITVAKDGKDIYLMGGHLSSTAAQNANKESLERLQELLEGQGERQEALLQEMSKNLRELSKAAQKGKFSLFR